MAKKKKHAKKKPRLRRKGVLGQKRLPRRHGRGRRVSRTRKVGRRPRSRTRKVTPRFEGETPQQGQTRKEIKTFADWLRKYEDAEEFEPEVEVEGAADS